MTSNEAKNSDSVRSESPRPAPLSTETPDGLRAARSPQQAAREINNCAANTDKELWRERVGDFYSPRIHVTQNGHIGIDVGGRVIVLDVHTWHWLGEYYCAVMPPLPQRGAKE